MKGFLILNFLLQLTLCQDFELECVFGDACQYYKVKKIDCTHLTLFDIKCSAEIPIMYDIGTVEMLCKENNNNCKINYSLHLIDKKGLNTITDVKESFFQPILDVIGFVIGVIFTFIILVVHGFKLDKLFLYTCNVYGKMTIIK